MVTESQNLPALDSAYDVSASDVAYYRENGHALLRGVATVDEIAPYRAAIQECMLAASQKLKPLAERDTYHQAFVQVGNLWENNAIVAKFTLAKRFAQVAADLMGVDGVRLYHDQALFKEAGGGKTPWHQDQYYWPLDNPNCVTMWMPLVDVPVEMGVLTFASGSQREGEVLSLAISDESEAALDAIVRDRGYPITRSAMKAGDATFHSGWTLHQAPPNKTDRCREIMTVIYIADGTRIIEPDNPHRPADLARWFPGQLPGEIASSPLNPLLFSRRA
ncbi:MAG: phytanoyl-CoA dioxygenase family protein [Phycisphaerales bacterium]|nr:phytanoyl-CoA dioxygenase family protein [Phycisphaerales bacterium]